MACFDTFLNKVLSVILNRARASASRESAFLHRPHTEFSWLTTFSRGGIALN